MVASSPRMALVVVAAVLLSAQLVPTVVAETWLEREFTLSGDGDDRDAVFTIGEGVGRLEVFIDVDRGDGFVQVELYDMTALTSDDPLSGVAGEQDVDAGDEARIVVQNPQAGQWAIDLESQGFEGDVHISATSDGGAGAALINIGGSFWDIAGVVLALVLAFGGLYLYRRRSTFLRRELNKIDETFSTMKGDVDECHENLVDLREHLKELLVRRKIEESQYLILERRIDLYLKDLQVPGNRHDQAVSNVVLDIEETLEARPDNG